MKKLCSILVAFALGGVGCTSDFDPYNELIGFRILAMRAEHPTLASGETTRIDALVHTSEGAEVNYAWSWCPFRGSSNDRFECALSHDELQSMVDATVGPGVVAIPPYALASTSSTSFTYTLPPLLFSGLCEALQSQPLPDFVEAPDCDGTFEITIRLVAMSEGKEIVGVKEIGLAYKSDAEINTNPKIEGLSFWPSDQDESVALPLERTAPPTLTRDKKYMLKMDIPENSAEPVRNSTAAQSREILFATWFIEGGETDSERTSFIDGEVGFDELTKNELTTPKKQDYDPSHIHLFFVLRDDRGGVTWDDREVLLMEP